VGKVVFSQFIKRTSTEEHIHINVPGLLYKDHGTNKHGARIVDVALLTPEEKEKVVAVIRKVTGVRDVICWFKLSS
jgi:hypothetical protein